LRFLKTQYLPATPVQTLWLKDRVDSDWAGLRKQAWLRPVLTLKGEDFL